MLIYYPLGPSKNQLNDSPYYEKDTTIKEKNITLPDGSSAILGSYSYIMWYKNQGLDIPE